MHNVRFMVLTGHLDDYTLPGLIKMLYGQRKTGRLQVEFAESPAAFYFEQGRLADARLGELRGLEALLAALALPGASFNFNPLVKPPEITFAEREQKFIREMLEAGSGDVSADAIAVSPHAADSSQIATAHAQTSSQVERAHQPSFPARAEEQLALEVRSLLDSHARSFRRERALYAALIAALLIAGFAWLPGGDRAPSPSAEKDSAAEAARRVTASEAARPAAAEVASAVAIAPTAAQPDTRARERAGADGQRPALDQTSSAKTTERTSKQAKETARSADAVGKTATEAAPVKRGDYVVRVVMRVEGGRVVQAAVQNSRPGMEAYEALALRMARQRRYPEAFSGQDALQVKVKQ